MSDYLAFRDGRVTRQFAKTTTTGTPDAGALVALNSDGKLDASIVPSGEQFIFTQSVPADTWDIAHNLDRFPTVTVLDSTGRPVEGDVQYVNSDSLILSFDFPFSGIAYVN